jgi:hypothetical protein
MYTKICGHNLHKLIGEAPTWVGEGKEEEKGGSGREVYLWDDFVG